MTDLDPRQWAYGTWWAPGEPGKDPAPLDPQPPAPPLDAAGNAIGLPDGWK